MEIGIGNTFTAVAISRGSEYDKRGFATEEAAEQWIVDNYCCKTCKEEHEKGLDTACMAEWGVMETRKYLQCRNLNDVFIACFGKPENPIKNAPNLDKCDNFKNVSAYSPNRDKA